jgi:hypothetical protein
MKRKYDDSMTSEGSLSFDETVLPLDLMPKDIWTCIFQYIEMKELAILELVSKRLQELCQLSHHWLNVSTDDIDKLSIYKIHSLIQKIAKIKRTQSIYIHVREETDTSSDIEKPIWFSSFGHEAFGKLTILRIDLYDDSITDSFMINLENIKSLYYLHASSNSGQWFKIFRFLSNLKNGIGLKLKQLIIFENDETPYDSLRNGYYLMNCINLLCDTKIIEELDINISISSYFFIPTILPNLKRLDTQSSVYFFVPQPYLSILNMKYNHLVFVNFSSTNLPNLKNLEISYMESMHFDLPFPTLEKLRIRNTLPIDSSVFVNSVYKNSLKVLNVSFTQIFKSLHLKSVCESFINLEELNIRQTFSAPSIKYIPNYLSKLKILYIGNFESFSNTEMDKYSVTDEIIRSLSKMESLKELYVSDIQVKGQVLTKDTPWPNLCLMDLSKCHNLECRFIHKGKYSRKKEGKKPIHIIYKDPCRLE